MANVQAEGKEMGAENAKEPDHIAIILDGNRRFAKKLMLQPWKGHEWGAKKVEKLLKWSEEIGLKELTLYAFSMQNFNRPKEEFDYLMNQFVSSFESLKERLPELKESGIRVRFLGRIDLFPERVYEIMKELMELTKDNDKHNLNFCMAYGGQEEIIDAVKKIGRMIEAGEITDKDVTKELIEANLYTAHEPDIIIRTGGDHRTSNFLIWQSWYSEWFFLEKTWPEFEKEDLLACIEQFKNRERRFGK